MLVLFSQDCRLACSQQVAKNKNKDKPQPAKKSKQLDNFDREMIRRTVHEFYENNQLPSCRMIQVRLNERDINLNKKYLSQYIKALGI